MSNNIRRFSFLFVYIFTLSVLLLASYIVTNVRQSNTKNYPKPQVAGVLTPPQTYYPTGDCNGDNKVDAGDLSAIAIEINDGDGDKVSDVSGGTFAGTISCDANADGLVNDLDTNCITGIIFNNPNQYCNVNNNGCVADINQDGVIDLSDYSLLAINFLKTNPSNIRADISNDGVVDISDFSVLQNNYLESCNL